MKQKRCLGMKPERNKKIFQVKFKIPKKQNKTENLRKDVFQKTYILQKQEDSQKNL